MLGEIHTERNNGISWPPPCLISRWFVTFSGKDTSCYCLPPAFWTPWNTRHANTHIQETLEEGNCLIWSFPDSSFSSEQGRTVFFSTLPYPSVSASLVPCHVDTRLYCYWIILECPIFLCVPPTDCPVDFSPYCQPHKKQIATGQEKLQEDICFDKVNMERAGLFCWKWLSSCLLPWPQAVGPFRAWLAEWRKEVAWPSTGSTGSGSLWPSLNPVTGTAVAGQGRPPSPCWRQSPADHKLCVRLSNKLAAHCHGSRDHHHGKRWSRLRLCLP